MRLKKADVEDAFYEWAAKAAGVEVVFSEQSNVKLDAPFITLKVISGPKRMGSTDDLEYVSGDDFKIIGRREMTISVQAFGCEAFDILSNLSTSFSEPDVQGFFQSKNIGIVDEGSPNDLTNLLDTDFQGRASMDIRFYVLDVKQVKVGTIRKTNVTGEIDTLDSIIETDQTVDAT